MPSPYEIAQGLVGTREGQAALGDFLKTGGQNLDPVVTAWCAAFVNASLNQAGLPGSGSMMARSFLNYGTPVDQPQVGDIAVFSRGRAPQGHVGFYQGVGPDGRIQVLGGNQGDAVSVKSFDAGSLLGYRRPGAQSSQPGAPASEPAPGAPPPPPIQNPVMSAIMGPQGDWMKNTSYSGDALASDFLAGHNPLRRFAYQKLMSLFV